MDSQGALPALDSERDQANMDDVLVSEKDDTTPAAPAGTPEPIYSGEVVDEGWTQDEVGLRIYKAASWEGSVSS